MNDEIREKLKEIPFFARVGGYVHSFKKLCSCCRICLSNDDPQSHTSTPKMDRKKWYDSIMSEYDENPERKPENEAAFETILSQGSLYTSAEFDNLFQEYRSGRLSSQSFDIASDISENDYI